MKPHIPTALVLAGLMGSVVAFSAAAQSSTTTTPPAAAASSAPPVDVAVPATAATPATDDGKAREAQMRADRLAYFNAHVAALHAGLGLTADQEKLWPPVEIAIRQVASMQMDFRRAMWTHRDDEHGAEAQADRGSDAIAAFKRTSDLIAERGKALGALADAVGPFYAGLDEQQKHRLPTLLQGMTPRRGPIAKLVMALSGSSGEDRSGMDEGRMDHRDDGGPRAHGHRWDDDQQIGHGDEDRHGGDDRFGGMRQHGSPMDEGRGGDDDREGGQDGSWHHHHHHWSDRNDQSDGPQGQEQDGRRQGGDQGPDQE